MSIDKRLGGYLRQEVLPKDISVTDAAKLLGTGRVALSNLLNGNSSLSVEMAARLEKAFGASAKKLMDMQAAFIDQIAPAKGNALRTQTYVPPFKQFKARNFNEWANTTLSRSRLAVLLRTLVHSSSEKLTKVDFPGNDDSERHGWDGWIVSNEATPWIPVGQSGWEFGVRVDYKDKAEEDYSQRLKLPVEERAQITFVFVTPRTWKGKSEWEKTKRALREFKNVVVYDASDLEQWMEQSIPGQVWFANELGLPSDGILTLDACWKNWMADGKDILREALFDHAVTSAKGPSKEDDSNSNEKTIAQKLGQYSSDPVIITADSKEEAVAFLNCLFQPGLEFGGKQPDPSSIRDRLLFFSEPGALTRLVSTSTTFIPVIMTPEVEREYAPYQDTLPAIIVYGQNGTRNNVDVSLDPLRYSEFQAAMLKIGKSLDEAEQLYRRSGGSLTVLRRQVSSREAICTPPWVSDSVLARKLIPFIFAGRWIAGNQEDERILTALSRYNDYSELEEHFADLTTLESSPVVQFGRSRGLISKIDALFAVRQHITQRDFDAFFKVAAEVLSQDDPALDLPEAERWMASIHGKVRDISGDLRNGISETLVLFATYEDSLFDGRFDTERATRSLIEAALSPIDLRKLEAQTDNLPTYAEASPKTFLSIIEADLRKPDSAVIKLMRPASTELFSRCPRTDILWALEALAWNSEHFGRVVKILAQLAETEIQDKWMNKPGASLSGLLQRVAPQTSASLDKRINALTMLCEKYPKAAWPILVQQFSRWLTPELNYRPRWRNDANGFGSSTKRSEVEAFADAAIKLALGWSNHNRETLADLVDNAVVMSKDDQNHIWQLIERWAQTANDDDKAWLRERVRTGCMTAHAVLHITASGLKPIAQTRIKKIYGWLTPSDLVVEHKWLFKDRWVADSADESVKDEIDFHSREARIKQKRINAVNDILKNGGIDAILRLAMDSNAADTIGELLVDLPQVDLLTIIKNCQKISQDLSAPRLQVFLRGILWTLADEKLQSLFLELNSITTANELADILLYAPFKLLTWRFIDGQNEEIANKYWDKVWVPLGRPKDRDVSFAVDKLIAIRRPRAAFYLVHLDLTNISARQLYDLMRAVAVSSEPEKTYMLEPYHIGEALKLLAKSPDITQVEMARLEFQYLEGLDRANVGTPNLEALIERQPVDFAQAIAMSYKRDDLKPDEFTVETDDELGKSRISAMHAMLERFKYIPGRDDDGILQEDRLLDWVDQVRKSCAEYGRIEIGDYRLGKLLAHAPQGKDGVWPCEPVREVLEARWNEYISQGITNGLYNARGVHSRGYGGDPEYTIVDRYRKWISALEIKYPQLTGALSEMAETYEREGRYHDAQDKVRRRKKR